MVRTDERAGVRSRGYQNGKITSFSQVWGYARALSIRKIHLLITYISSKNAKNNNYLFV